MGAPLVLVLVALAAGMAGWIQFGWAAPLWSGVFGALALWMGRLPSWTVWLALIMTAGAFWTGVRATDASLALRPWEGQEVSLTGWVDGEPVVGDGRAAYYLRVETLEGHQVRGRIAVADYRGSEETGGGSGIASGMAPPSYGDRLWIRGRLEAPRAPGNPGEFDYAAYLARQGIHLRTSLWRTEDLAVLPAGGGNWLIKSALKTRKALEGVFRQTLTPERAALISGLLFGSRGDLAGGVEKDFRLAGIYHLLAVSGSNVAFVALPCLGLFLRLGFGRTVSALLACLVVIFFVFLTGATASVTRAGIMAVIGLMAQALGRRNDSWNALAAAGTGILVINPLQLYDAGFQLSFAATAGILALTRTIEDLIKRLPVWIRSPLAVTLAAQVAVLPISLYYFAGVSVVSLVANLVVVPMVAALVYLGSLAALIGLVWLPPALPLIWLSDLLLWFLEVSASMMAGLPGAFLYFPTPSAWMVAIYYLALGWAGGIIAVTWLPGFRGWRAVHWAMVVLMISAASVWSWAWSDPPGTLEVVFLDVGQGDAIFIRFPDGRAALVDGGGRPDGPLVGGYDPGERVITPFLRRRGITRIDDLVLTHPHGDHAGGLEAVVRDFKVSRVWYGGRPYPGPQYQRWLGVLNDSAGRGRLSWRIPSSGDLMHEETNLAARFLHPPGEPLEGTRSDENNNSLVLRVDYRVVSFLLTGDAEAEAERALLSERPGDLPATVLKVGHHGSNYSSTGDFLDRVRPSLAVIQVGRNSFGHPATATLERLTSRGIRVLRNDLNGAVTVKTDGKGLAARTYK